MTHAKRILSVLLALVLVFSLGTAAFAAKSDVSWDKDDLPGHRTSSVNNVRVDRHQPGDQVRVIVLMKSQPLADNKNAVEKSLNTERKLKLEQAAVRAQMDKEGVPYELNFTYTTLANGMSITIDYADLETVRSMPGVKQAFIASEYKLPEPQPNADTAAQLTGAATLAKNGYAGSGKVIAVLDTGVSVDHEAFAVYPGMLKTPKLDESSVNEAIDDLGYGAYYSQKVPFMYDYADGDNDARDITDGQGSDHGTHVAGIAAGYAEKVDPENGDTYVSFYGSAPDAQILAMKIFSTGTPTTSSDIYVAALEDAMLLDADVINMSIGAQNGFSSDDETAFYDNVYQRLRDAGVICCCSAGNESSMGKNASTFVGYPTADYADYGVLGSPASYDGNVAIAAMENYQYPAYVITVGEDGKFPYTESHGADFLDTFGGKDLEFVPVQGPGNPEDFEGMDLKGKIALIQRGSLNFSVKITNAYNAGAAGVVVFNNTPNDPDGMLTMAVDAPEIPSVFVSYNAGMALVELWMAAQEAEAPAVFTVGKDLETILNPNRFQMSSFSSWGPTPDLKLKPTITGVGGNVNSAKGGTADGYVVYSGTSMSAPNVSGSYAALLDILGASYKGLDKATLAEVARNLTLSSATVLPSYGYLDDDGNQVLVPYSPRQQGAGLIDVVSAVTTDIMITEPLVELGDDPARDGVYSFEVEVTNLSDEEQTYAVSVDALVDAAEAVDVSAAQDGSEEHNYNALMSLLLEAGDATIDVSETVTVPAGESVTVPVKITLSDELKSEYLDVFFENGTYVDGYVTFTNVDEDAEDEAHATFLAFYGDWNEGPVFEEYDWRDRMALPPEYRPYYSSIYEINTDITFAYLTRFAPVYDEEGNPVMNEDGTVATQLHPVVYPGDNPLGDVSSFNEDRINLSNNAEESHAQYFYIEPMTIRNARHLIMVAYNPDTMEIYAMKDDPFIPKAAFDSDYGYWAANVGYLFDGCDAYGYPLKDGTKVVFNFYANVDFGDDELDLESDQKIASDLIRDEQYEQYLGYQCSLTMDSTAPEILDCIYDHESGNAKITVKDNGYLAGVYLCDENGYQYALDENGEPYTYDPNDETMPEDPNLVQALFADDEPGQTKTVILHIGQLDSFYLGCLDYATNETAALVTPDEDVHVHTIVKMDAAEPTCEEDGNIACYYCPDCEKYFSDELGENELNKDDVVLPATGHDWDDGQVTKPATAEEEGEMTYTCKNDPSHTKTEVIPKVGECDGGENCPSKKFKDVDQTLWYHEAVDYVIVNKLFSGTSADTFMPDLAMTRAMFVTVLHRMDGKPAPEAKAAFTDVAEDMWYSDAVAWASENGIVNGIGNNLFAPDQNVTREQVMALLMRYAKFKGMDVSKRADLSEFADADTVSPWALESVQWAVGEGLIKGCSDGLKPQDGCTRAQAAAIFMRFQQSLV